MKKIKNFIIKHKFPIFFFFVAFVILLFTSKNSFIYRFNTWVDANAFFTMGKSMVRGVIPYKEIFEQKGPLLYLIYGIGSLISYTSFHGVFILEVISFTVFLYYVHKIFSMYLDKKYSFILIPIVAFAITTTKAYTHGGSCEEFCLPYMAISLYYFIRHFKEKPLTNKEIIINGLMAGIVLTMKYTILGFWIGFGFFIFLDLIIKKKIKESFMFCIKFLIGMSIPFIIFVIYFLITGGLKEFIDDYFIINMTAYPNSEKLTIFRKLYRIARSVYRSINLNFPFIAPLIYAMPITVWFIKDKNKYLKFSLIGLMGFTFFFIYFGLKYYIYYIIPTTIFIVITLLGVVSILDKYISKIINKKYMYIVFSIIFVLFGFLSYYYSQNKDEIMLSRDSYFQYKYADYINKYDNPTLLNMGTLDVGVYTTSGVIPTTQYFEVQNFEYKLYPYNIDSLNRNAKNKDTMFIVYATWNTNIPKEISDNYDKVYEDIYYFEGSKRYAFLYKVKGLEEK